MNKKNMPANKIQDLQFFGEFGGVNNIIFKKPNIGQGAYIINGKLVNKGIADWFNLPYEPLNLF